MRRTRSGMMKAMGTAKAQQIWTFLAVITVGSTVLALLAANGTKAGATAGCSTSCTMNSECGCTIPEETPGCNLQPPGYCSATNAEIAPGTCICDTAAGFGGPCCEAFTPTVTPTDTPTDTPTATATDTDTP